MSNNHEIDLSRGNRPAAASRKIEVVFLTLVLMHYRCELHQNIRDRLEKLGIRYRLIYSDPKGSYCDVGGTVDLDWAEKVPVTKLDIFGQEVFFQHFPLSLRNSTLLIIGQETKLIHNFPLLLRRIFTSNPKIAFFGHGRNFQSSPNRTRELLKRVYSRLADWWFCYTDQSARYIKSIGFTDQRISVFNNSIDTRELKKQIDSISEIDLELYRRAKLFTGKRILLFLGSIHKQKRIDFLLDAFDIISKTGEEFILVLAGGGQISTEMRQRISSNASVYLLSAVYGKEKALLLKAADLLVMPGLVGLVALDAMAARKPIVTTDYPFHSPEACYVIDELNGVVVRDFQSPSAFATACLELSADNSRYRRMCAAQEEMLPRYSIEAAADRIVTGIAKVLELEHS